MESFDKKQLTLFRKLSILDIWESSEYASVIYDII